MTDAFNPQEILARLRAKPVTAQFSTNNNGNNTNASSGASQGKGNNNNHVSSASSIGSSSHTNANSKSRHATSSNTNGNNSSATLGFGAVPAQHPYVNDAALQARQELEREVLKLQQEIHTLKQENKLLKQDKEDIARHFLDYKSKSDDTIAKLRGKLSKLAILDTPLPPTLGSKIEGTGKLYPKPTSNASSPNRNSSSPVKNRDLSASIASNASSHHNNHHTTDEAPFMEPTFSELMRRNTQDPIDFTESLRRPRGGAGYTNGYVHLSKSHAASIQERGLPHNASTNTNTNNNTHNGSSQNPRSIPGYPQSLDAQSGPPQPPSSMAMNGSGLTQADLSTAVPSQHHTAMLMSADAAEAVYSPPQQQQLQPQAMYAPPNQSLPYYYNEPYSYNNNNHNHSMNSNTLVQTYQPFGGAAGRTSVPQQQQPINNYNNNNNNNFTSGLKRTASAPPMSMFNNNNLNGNSNNANNHSNMLYHNNVNNSMDEYHHNHDMALPVLEVDLTR